MATKIVTRVSDGLSLEAATQKTLEELKPYDGFAGIIGISHTGEIFHAGYPSIYGAGHLMTAMAQVFQ